MYRRLINWLANQSDDPAELRNAPRIQEPGVVVYYWDGATPSGRQLRDISRTGAYLYTPERWYPGTVVRLLIQPKESSPDTSSNRSPDASPNDPGSPPGGSVSLQAKVVWHGPDGMALEFLFHGPADRKILEELIAGSHKNQPSSPPSGVGPKASLAGGEAA